MVISKQLKGSLCLILCSFIWGMAFSAQSSAMRYIQPFTFVFCRCVVSSIVLFAALPLLTKLSGGASNEPPRRAHFKLGALLGVILVTATALQQIGLVYTTTAKSGFVTALYIVIVPLIGLFMGRRVGRPVWLGVALSLTGLILLCVQSNLSVNVGDVITLLCALVFAFHIITIDRYAGPMNAVRLTAIQFAVGAVLSGIIAFIVETPTWSGIAACWPSILYVAVFSSAIGYTLQILGQQRTEPTLASLLMCLESVFAALGGWVLLGQGLTPRELIGCALMLAASAVAQLPDRRVAR